jgi:hypothetical protein
MCVQFLLENLKEETTRKIRHRWEDNIKMDVNVIVFGLWITLFWSKIGTGGGLLLTR